MKTKRVEFYFLLAAYLVELGVLLIILKYVANLRDKIFCSFLLVLFSLITTFFTPKETDAKLKKLFYFLIQTLIITIPIFMKLDFTPFLFLFFILSAQAMLVFDISEGLYLQTFFGLVTILSFVIFKGLIEGITISITYVGGYYFFGLFGYLMKVAEKNSLKLENALKELSEAHEKLKDYMVKSEELAVTKERERLSQELHDTLGHYLTIASIQLEGALKVCDEDSKKSREMMINASKAVKDALGSLRNAVSALKSPIEGELPLDYSVGRLTKNFEEGSGIKVHLEVTSNLDVPKIIRENIYRIVQELLTNVKKHSNAKNVWISIGKTSDKFYLSFVDDGVGFDFEKDSIGFGLSNIKNRVENLKGRIILDNAEGKGARIYLEIPLDKDG